MTAKLVTAWTLGLALTVAACDQNSSLAAAPSCRAIAQFAPRSATIHVGDSVVVGFTIQSGCPAPLARNQTPSILQVNQPSAGGIHIVGLAAGSGRVRILAAVDTTLADSVQVTVLAPGT